MDRDSLRWQSKLILLLVLPVVGCGLAMETRDFLSGPHSVIYWNLGLSAALGVLTLAIRAATPFAAIAGALITAQLMYATTGIPFRPWNSFLAPVIYVSLLAYIATRIGRAKKEKLGTAEARRGRSAAQVAANLGAAALFATVMLDAWTINISWPHPAAVLIIAILAAMAEAAADTVSSEIGQVFGGRPRLLTTLRPVEPGTDGGITFVGSLAGIATAAIVIGLAILTPWKEWTAASVTLAGAIAGLFFDSLLGATLERRGWLNNDAVNFLSTIFAGAIAAWLAERFVHFPSM